MHTEKELIAKLKSDNEKLQTNKKILTERIRKLRDFKKKQKVTVVNKKADMVNHPPHYQGDGIECIDAIRAALGKEGFVAYCRGNAIKYTWREKADSAEDRNKAIWYLNRANKEDSGVNND